MGQIEPLNLVFISQTNALKLESTPTSTYEFSFYLLTVYFQVIQKLIDYIIPISLFYFSYINCNKFQKNA